MSVPWLLLAFFIGIVAVSTLIRKMGWRNQTEMTWIWGVILPDIFGIGTLLFVVNWMSK